MLPKTHNNLDNSSSSNSKVINKEQDQLDYSEVEDDSISQLDDMNDNAIQQKIQAR
jgi:hypothetical protein